MANNTLNNLKSIYNIENNGTILEILRNIRNSRSNLDTFGKSVVKRKKEIALKIKATYQNKKNLLEIKSLN